ncbi:DUF2920 family protein [Paenibacillus sp. FSL R7-0337]|uniref:DUF2920 family protein n=1 Tax=Paenibacillus sp. FSL R7-0337 TaxID=1926588 RepID=UPI00096C23BB|nr:DUF2920 family protein [Paenibacillus sp. FSL R7-0337]OMF91059.1 hypothetical protein BK147_22630 [Paenibacillus sp. FSL R7-0337]
MGTLSFAIKPHADIELGFSRKELDYYVTSPVEGVTGETGLILTIPGFGGLANSVYQLEKLNPYLAEKYNCLVVSLKWIITSFIIWKRFMGFRVLTGIIFHQITTFI